jgi:hypothetical protein
MWWTVASAEPGGPDYGYGPFVRRWAQSIRRSRMSKIRTPARVKRDEEIREHPPCDSSNYVPDEARANWLRFRSSSLVALAKFEDAVEAVAAAVRESACSSSSLSAAPAGLEPVHPTWHWANPNLQADGLPFAVEPSHSKHRGDGYRK